MRRKNQHDLASKSLIESAMRFLVLIFWMIAFRSLKDLIYSSAERSASHNIVTELLDPAVHVLQNVHSSAVLSVREETSRQCPHENGLFEKLVL